MFIIARILNLNEVSKSKLDKVKIRVITINEKTNIKIDKKYLFISFLFKLILFKDNLLE